jgi:16S rRNA (cytosine1402-N4)-methyltransferase
MSEYHVPVMLNECLEGLALRPGGVYVDVTFGGGGHTRAILAKLNGQGQVYAFDQDPDAAAEAAKMAQPGLTFIPANFRYLRKFLRLCGAGPVDGVLADLGVSSHQFDAPERGFSIRHEAELDMRMNPGQGPTAAQVLAQYPETELHRLLGMYGEVRNAKSLAAGLVSARAKRPIRTVDELKEVLARFAPKFSEYKYFAQVFQALRIEVNDELKALEEFLTQVPQVLKPGGRLVAMSYHSLEDRLVKNFVQRGKFYGQVEKDLYGNDLKPLRAVSRGAIEPTAAEIEQNNRARSAKLRIAEKV